MTAPTNNEWIHDWNQASAPLIPPGTRVLLNDETLRDGLQNPSVYDPSIEEKIEILHLMESLGMDSLNTGPPGAGPRAVAHTEALAREIAANRMKIRPNAAARTVEADIRPIAEISQRVGIAIEAATFLGSSPIRRLVEDWTVDHLERTTEKAVKFAVEHNLPSMYVTEDTIRTDPETLKFQPRDLAIQAPPPPQGILRKSCSRHAHHHSAKLSRHRPRRLPHRHRRARRRHHQGLSQKRRRPRRRRLQRRPVPSLRPGPDHRDRPDERQIQRALLARAPRHPRP